MQPGGQTAALDRGRAGWAGRPGLTALGGLRTIACGTVCKAISAVKQSRASINVHLAPASIVESSHI